MGYGADAAQAVLTAAAVGLAEAGQTVPSRVYVSPGRPVADCEALAANVEQVLSGAPDDPVIGVANCLTRYAVIRVSLIRCVPGIQEDGAPPPVEWLDDAGKAAADDFLALHFNMGDHLGRHRGQIEVGTFEPQGGFLVITADVSVPIPFSEVN